MLSLLSRGRARRRCEPGGGQACPPHTHLRSPVVRCLRAPRARSVHGDTDRPRRRRDDLHAGAGGGHRQAEDRQCVTVTLMDDVPAPTDEA